MQDNVEYSINTLLASGGFDKAIIVLIYIVFFMGIFVLIADVLKEMRDKVKRVIADKKSKATLKKKESAIDKNIRYLLEANRIHSKITVKTFKLLCFLIFLFFFLLAQRVLLLGIALLGATTISMIPYLMLRVRLEKIRSLASHEAEVLINELLVKYRIKNYNIEETIEEVIRVSRIDKTKRILARLLLRLRNTRSDHEIREAVNVFAYSVGTNWAKMLASNIYQSSVSNINITASLEDILIQLRKARKLWEEKITSTAEPRRILAAIPLLYILLLYVALEILELPVRDYIHNQFASEQGVTLFIMIIIGFASSFVLVKLMFSKKFDF